jgi:hypothetical protein
MSRAATARARRRGLAGAVAAAALAVAVAAPAGAQAQACSGSIRAGVVPNSVEYFFACDQTIRSYTVAPSKSLSAFAPIASSERNGVPQPPPEGFVCAPGSPPGSNTFSCSGQATAGNLVHGNFGTQATPCPVNVGVTAGTGMPDLMGNPGGTTTTFTLAGDACSGTAPSGGPSPPARDTAAPRLRVTGARRQRAVRRRGVVLSATCSEYCGVSVTGRISARGMKRITLREQLKIAVAGQRTRLIAALSPADRRRLARAVRRRRARASLRVVATDPTGNGSSVRKRVTIVR